MPGLRRWVLAPFNQQKLERGQTSSSGEGGYPGIHAKERTRVTGCPRLLQGAWAASLKGVRVREHQRIWREEPLGWSAHPLGGAARGDQAKDPAFAPSTSDVAVGV